RLDPPAYADEGALGDQLVEPVGVLPDAALALAAPVRELEAEVGLGVRRHADLLAVGVVAADEPVPLGDVVDARPWIGCVSQPRPGRGRCLADSAHAVTPSPSR